jgi:hypothetical protein
LLFVIVSFFGKHFLAWILADVRFRMIVDQDALLFGLWFI